MKKAEAAVEDATRRLNEQVVELRRKEDMLA